MVMGKASWPLHSDQDVVAIDCEMVGVAVPGRPGSNWKNTLCRVSVVSLSSDWQCQIRLDTWVEVKGTVMDWRSAITGVDAETFARKDKLPFEEVKARVRAIIAGRIVVGHAVWNDLEVLQLTHPDHLLRDTALYPRLRPPWLPPDRLPSLRHLAQDWLEMDIHRAVHDSVQDAIAPLRLYALHQASWERWLGNSCDFDEDGAVRVWLAEEDSWGGSASTETHWKMQQHGPSHQSWGSPWWRSAWPSVH